MTTNAASARPIVAGVDGSPGARRALEWAAEEAQRRDCPLVAVTAWHYPPQLGAVGVAVNLDMEGVARDMLDKEIGAVVPAGGAAVERRVLPGYAPAVLVEAAKDAELLVVGSRGHGELAGMLLGSVSLHCATQAHCTVVIVRPD